MSGITIAEYDVEVGVKGDKESLSRIDKMRDKIQGNFKSLSQKASSSLKTISTNVKIITAEMGGLSSVIGKVGSSIATAGIALGIGAVSSAVALVGEETARLDTIAKSAQKSGLGFEAFQRLSHVATLSGANIDNLSKGVGFLNVELEKIARGATTGPVVEALDELGVKSWELAGIAPEEQLALISDALANVPSDADKARIAFKLMSEDGKQLVPLFNSGGEAIRKMSADVGEVFTREQLASAEAYQDALANLKKSISSLAGSAATSLAPLFTDIANGIQKWVEQNRGVIDQAIPKLERAFEKIYKSITGHDLLGLFEKFAGLVELVFNNFDLLIGIFAAAKTLTAISSVTAGLTSMGIAASSALGPIGLIAAAVAALIPLALRAGEALGDVISKQHAVATAPRGGGTDLAAGGIYAPELQSKAAKQSEELLAAEAATRKLEEEGVSGYRLKEAKRREAEARIRLRDTQAAIDGKVKEAKAAEAAAKAAEDSVKAKAKAEADQEEAEFGQFDRDVAAIRETLGLKEGEEATGNKAKKLNKAVSVLAAGGTLAEASKGLTGGGGGKKKAAEEKTSDTSATAAFVAIRAGGKDAQKVFENMKLLGKNTPDTKGVVPTVAITNNLFDIKFSINNPKMSMGTKELEKTVTDAFEKIKAKANAKTAADLGSARKV